MKQYQYPSILSFLRSKYSILLLGIFLILQISCEKFVQVDIPKTQLTANAVFQNETTANAVLSNLYVFASSYIDGGFYSASLLGALSSDETDCWSTSVEVLQLAGAQIIPSNTYSTNLWASCYGTIYRANSIIEGTTANSALSKKTIKQLNGEALFFRALSHFTLTNFFGKIPLVLSTEYRANTIIPQSEISVVFSSIISDLERAKTLLQPNYNISGMERIRPNRYAATALLARVHLYNGDYAAAEKCSSEVIAATELFSLPDVGAVFLKNSKETILSFKPYATNQNSGDGARYVLTAKPTYISLNTLFANSFEVKDQRKAAWVSKINVAGFDYYYPSKYKVKNSTIVTEYSIMLRLAEQYLIRAEARARMDKLTLSISDIDKIRSRAGLPLLALTNPHLTKDELLTQILLERRSELFTEWGHRWMDLKRFGQLTEVLRSNKPGFVSTAALFPIPATEISLNNSLTQNPGY